MDNVELEALSSGFQIAPWVHLTIGARTRLTMPTDFLLFWGFIRVVLAIKAVLLVPVVFPLLLDTIFCLFLWQF